MKVCFPVVENQNLESRVHGRFGTAKLFLLVDSETRQVERVIPCDPADGPFWEVSAAGAEAVVVGNIGARSLLELERRGMKVFQASKSTVADNLESMANSGLPELTDAVGLDDVGPVGRGRGGVGLGAGPNNGVGRGIRCRGGRGTGQGFGRGAGRGGRGAGLGFGRGNGY